MALLRGRAAGRAHLALAALSKRFLRLRDFEALSLGYGLAGIALAHVSLDRLFPQAGHDEGAESALENAITELAKRSLRPGLYGGFTGLAWVATYLDQKQHPQNDRCASIDDALIEYLDSSPWTEPFDLIEGLVGLGVYALERLPRRSGRRLTASVVRRLAETSCQRDPGIAWRSDPRWVPRKWRRQPHPEWNLGVAHGVPGIIGFLGRVVAADVDAATRKKARAMLEKAVVWLLAQELPKRAIGGFATAAMPGIPLAPAPLAWCYGDPGIAATLLLAARGAREPAWRRAAVRIGLRAAARSRAASGVIDTGMCHGTAGVAHVFHRLYLGTGQKRFGEASRVWFSHTLAKRKVGRGFAGFRAHLPDDTGSLRWRTDPSFLTGAAGIALALAAAITDDEPHWDRVLLIS